MKNDTLENYFNSIAPVPYSREFTEKVMENIGDRMPVPFFRIFLLIVLWGGLIYITLDSPETILSYLKFEDKESATGLISDPGLIAAYFLRLLMLMFVPVSLSVLIMYDYFTETFNKLTENLLEAYNRKGYSLRAE